MAIMNEQRALDLWKRLDAVEPDGSHVDTVQNRVLREILSESRDRSEAVSEIAARLLELERRTHVLEPPPEVALIRKEQRVIMAMQWINLATIGGVALMVLYIGFSR